MKNKKGFTLIEIIVTICLLAVLMAAAVPGLMNYFGDVDEDKYISETKAIVAQVESSYSQLSLAGSYSSSSLPESVANDIIKKANGSGVIDFVKFENGKLAYLSYKVGGLIVNYDLSLGDDSYFVLNDDTD